MLEIKNHNGKYFFEIEVEKQVIRQYGLENIVWNSQMVNNPIYDQNLHSLQGEGSIVHQFTMPPYATDFTEEYYQYIQTEYNKILNDIEEQHHGNLLFLSYTYFLTHQEKRKLTDKQNHFRKKGKLLYELIRVQTPRLNKNNVYDAFRGYPFFETPFEDLNNITNLILSYLVLLSGQKDQYFLKDGKINFHKIKAPLWEKLTVAIKKECSIPITVQEENQQKKILYLSQNIVIKFQAKKYKANNPLLSTEEKYQNRQLVQVLAQHLFNEQKEQDTDFYRAILEFDFSMSTNFTALSATVGDYYKTHHLYNLSKVYLALMQYLEEHELLKGDTNPQTNRLRSNFIYQYFLLLGLMQTDTKGEITGYDDLSDLKNKVEITQEKLLDVSSSVRKRFAAIKLHDDLKDYLPKAQVIYKKKGSVR